MVLVGSRCCGKRFKRTACLWCRKHVSGRQLWQWREKIHAGDFLCPQWSVSQRHNSRTAFNKSQGAQGLCDPFIMSWLGPSGIRWALQLQYIKFNYNCRGKKWSFHDNFQNCSVYHTQRTVTLSVIVFQHCMAIEARVTLCFQYKYGRYRLPLRETVSAFTSIVRLHITHVDAVVRWKSTRKESDKQPPIARWWINFREHVNGELDYRPAHVLHFTCVWNRCSIRPRKTNPNVLVRCT